VQETRVSESNHSRSSELLRHQQCVKQIDHQQHADGQHEDRFKIHGFTSANPITKSRIADGKQEERHRNH
jgi:hypothetical protein